MANAKKWTLMFYFASDNSLAPVMVSQVKAIKDAGFREEANVLVYFDPSEEGVPTRIFDVNKDAKKKPNASRIGDGEDSFVRDMREDYIDPVTMKSLPGEVTQEFAAKLDPVDTIDPEDSLSLFMGFCREQYEADHYMLFLMGHGMIVASDDFLPDTRPKAGISLVKLGEIMGNFSNAIKGRGVLELLGLPSCSMSAIEVAYQLKGTANYMLGSQGFSFVGSWPYRQLVKKTLKVIKDDGDNIDIPDLIFKLSRLCLHNSTDFMFMGHSADVCLCKLTKNDVVLLNKPIQDLVRALKKGLGNPKARDLILLAHWRSQSFWLEMYTDLFDLCFCLNKSCDENDEFQGPISDACKLVMNELKKPFVRSDHFGTLNQYSHGLSVYFPWSKPLGEVGVKVEKAYTGYSFTIDLKDDSWFSFLDMYWSETQRKSRKDENRESRVGAVGGTIEIETLDADTDNSDRELVEMFTVDGILGSVKPDPVLAGTKPDPTVGKDGDCTCPTIKNYPTGPFFSEGVNGVSSGE
jgi:hypothetical protein